MIKRVFSQSVLAMGVKISASAAGVLMNILVARLLSLQEFGFYSIIFSLLLSFMFLGTFGMHVSVMQYYPKIEKQFDVSSADHFLYQAYLWLKKKWLLAFMAMTILGGGFIAFQQYLDSQAYIVPLYAVPFIAGLAICLTLSEFLSAVLRIKEYNISALAPRDLYWRAIVCAVIGIFLMLQMNIDLGTLLIIMAVLAAFVIACQTRLFLKILNFSETDHSKEYCDKKELSISLRYSWANILAMTLIFQFVISVVGHFLGAEQAGIYFAADRLAYMMGLINIALTLIATPVLSKAFHNNQRKKLRRLYMMICAFGGAMTLPILLGIIFYGDWILAALYGGVFAEGHKVFVIIGGAWFLSTVFGPIVSVGQAAGQERIVFIVTAIVASTSLLLSLFLVPLYGSIGAALSVLFMAMFQKSTLLILLYKKIIAD